MKRVLSLVLALVLVLGMIPTFAADMTAGQHLFEHEFIAGDGMGNLNEDQLLTREQLAKLILELNGSKEEAEALTLPPSFTDSAKISAWARPYVAYAQIEGLMVGFTDGSFRPQEGVTGQQLAAVLTRALGYEFSWATVLADAADLGIEVANVAKLTRGQAFEAMWVTVNTKPEGEELTLGQLLGKIDPPAPEAPLAVVSATATNLKEVVVTFNKELTASKVVVGNFRIGNADAASVTLSADKMSVTVVPGTISAVNPANYALVVKAAVGIAADYTATVKAFDTTLPVVQSVTLTGPQTFEILFSEPMNTVGTVKVNNGVYGVTVPVAITSNKAVITLAASSLPEGNYTVTVAGYKDYAGFAISSTDLTLAYVKDTAVPTATISGTPTQTQVIVKFDKVVTLNNANLRTDYFYHTFTAWQPNTVVADPDGRTFTLTFTTYPIPAGTTNVVVNYKGLAADSNIVDAWGNKVVSNIVLPVTVVADNTAPTVTEVSVTNEQTVVVKFSESLNAAAAKAKAEDESNFIVKDKDGKVVATSFTNTYAETPADGLYKVTMAFASKLTGGNYTVEIKNLIDSSLNANVMAATTQAFVITDKTPIDFAVAGHVVAKAIESTEANVADIIYVTFNEPMAITGQYSVLATSNYLLNGAAFPTGTTITAFGTTGKVIKISVPENATFNQQTVDGATLTLARVADLAGNATVAISTTRVVGTETAPQVTSVAQTDSNKITVVVNQPLSVVLASGLKVTGGATVAAIDSWSVNSDNETVIKATLDAADASSATNTAATIASIDVVANILVSETGVKMGAATFNTIDDERAPKLIASNPITLVNGKIEIAFTENLDNALASLYAQDLVLVKGSTTQVAGVGYRTVVSANKIVIEKADGTAFTDGAFKVSSKAEVTYIRDAAANKAVPFTTVKEFTAQQLVDSVAAAIANTFAPAQAAAGTTALPTVPAGYTIAVKTTSDATKYDLTGKIQADGVSNVVFTVTQTASGLVADTVSVAVTVDVA